MNPSVLAALLLLSASTHASGTQVSSQTRSEVTGAVIAHLVTDYVDPDAGERAAAALKDAEDEGHFQGLGDGEAFAEAISRLVREYTGDGHLNVQFSEAPIDLDEPVEDAFSAEEMTRWYGPHLNHGVEGITRLEGNVALLDLRVFPPVEMGGDTIAAAMQVIANMDALIIDLRRNGGGSGTSTLVMSYLFDDEPRPLSGVYDRPTDTLRHNQTLSYVPGKRFGPHKPVYVLTSARTFSAAESVAYDLQALGRAVVVGEVTGGGAHPFAYVPIHPHFVLWSVTAKSVNPITGGNWQGVGVQPDVSSSAEDALQVALAHLGSRYDDPTDDDP